MKKLYKKLIFFIAINLIFTEIYDGYLLYSPNSGGGGGGGGNYTRLIDNDQNIRQYRERVEKSYRGVKLPDDLKYDNISHHPTCNYLFSLYLKRYSYILTLSHLLEHL